MTILRSTALLLALALPGAAHAGMSCDDIMKMLSYNVPVNTVVTSVRGSGGGYTQADVQCLQQRGAPPEVVNAVAGLAGGAAPAPAPIAAPPAYPVPVPRAPVPAPATPRPAPAPTSSFDGTDMLGGAAVQPAIAEPPSGGAPPAIEQLVADYKAKKYLTCSKGFYDLLEKNAYPDQAIKVQYHLASCLESLQLYHGAYYYYSKVVSQGGPGNPYFKYAMPGMVRIANLTGDDKELLRIVAKIPPEAFPREAQNQLNYLMGRKMYEGEELNKAKEFFEKVSPKSDLFMRAQFFLGSINVEQQRFKSAVLNFREVMTAEPPVVGDARAQGQIEDMKDLALINVARIYFGIENYENAGTYYQMVDRESTYWAESLFEHAWADFHRGDVNGVLGLLLTANSPYFSDNEFIPEITVLRALTFFNLCEWKEVEKILIDFDAQYKPMQTEIKALLDKYSDDASKGILDQAFDEYFAKNKEQSTLQRPLFVKILRNRDLQAYVDHMDVIDKELTLIEAQKAEWKVTVGEGLKKIYADDRVKIKRSAGATMLNELSAEYKNLTDLLSQSQIIRFEVVDAQRADYEFRMASPDISSAKDEIVDYATDPRTIYWPFNGEFWADELGYYRYTETGACK